MLDVVVNSILNNLDPVVMIIFLLGGIFSKHYLVGVNINNAWKTLIVGSIFVLCWIIIQVVEKKFVIHDLEKYFFSYALVTSLYELFLKYFIDQVMSKLGVKKESIP